MVQVLFEDLPLPKMGRATPPRKTSKTIMNNTVEAEVMENSQALAVRPSMAVGQAMSVDDILAQVNLIQKVMRSVMKEGEHYGTIPGCGDKKTLLQPGAQKLTMTFRLAPEYDIKEINLDRGHKEFRVICTLKSMGTGAFVGQGVGYCSSMESKYRYRGGARVCPECGKATIIKGKKDFGGGWLCWTKKGGCGAKWDDGAKEIEGQSEEKIENENPADTFNTVLKIAKKRSFVDATITATAASDIFTQDIGDGEDDDIPMNQGQTPPAQPKASTPKTSPGNVGRNTRSTNIPETDDKTLFVNQLRGKLGSLELENLFLDFLETTKNAKQEFFIDPGQSLFDCDLEDLKSLFNHWDKTVNPRFIEWQAQHRPEKKPPITMAADKRPATDPDWAKPTDLPLDKKSEKERPLSVDAAVAKDPEWFWDVIITMPYKGMKRADYMKKPDTIGSLWKARHENHEAMKRLMGLASHFEAKGWTNSRGQTMPASDADKTCRLALDAFIDWYAKHGKDTEKEPQQEFASVAAKAPVGAVTLEGAAPEEDEDLPF